MFLFEALGESAKASLAKPTQGTKGTSSRKCLLCFEKDGFSVSSEEGVVFLHKQSK